METTYSSQVAKPLSLVLLAIQNFTYGILLPLSRKPDENGNQFFAPSSVVAMELIKITIAIFGIFAQPADQEARQGNDAGQGSSQYQLLPSATPLSSASSAFTIGEHDGDDRDDDGEGGDSDDDDDSDDGNIKEKHSLVEKKVEQNDVLEAPLDSVETKFSIWGHIQSRFRSASKEVFTAQAFRMSIPAVLYVVQNNLQMFSGGYLDSTEFQVLSQLKLVSTAVFSVWLLGKRLSKAQWASIALLFAGTAIVQCASILTRSQVIKAATDASTVAAVKQVVKQDKSLLYGTTAIVLACICSGLAGVLIEMQLKQKTDFWVTNLHLSMFSIVPAFVPIFTDSVIRSAFDPFRFFNVLVWSTVIVNAIGGLLVAMVLKFADNILKGFAICAALLVTVFYNGWMSGQGVSALQLLGASLVAASTIWYAKSPPPPKA